MENIEHKYRNIDDVRVQSQRWLWKNRRMLVCIEGHHVIVEKHQQPSSWAPRVKVWVYTADVYGRFGRGNEFTILFRSEGIPLAGWDSEEAFVESARQAWFIEHQRRATKKQEKP